MSTADIESHRPRTRNRGGRLAACGDSAQRASRLFSRAPAPVGQQCEQVEDADGASPVEIPQAHSGADSIKEVCRAGVGTVVVVAVSPNDGGGAADRDGPAEPVKSRAVVGQE